ncbi:DUF305 domain-containing protein [Candidatus Peribacteria bacterium]|nr:DUF305 domain-containing protein [Candidatus Peribacteria bacterium]
MLVSVGIVACLFTIAVRGSLWNMGHGKGSSMKMGMGGMMGNMMDDDDMMEMSMDDMSDMLKGKTGDAFDEAFIEGMIPHHQGAIDMAKAALTDAKHAEIKRMAQAIISAQQKEIDQMHAWQKSWGYQE